MYRMIIAIGAFNALLATACGAFAAHVLQGQIDERALQTFGTGAEYHMYHALGLVLVGILGIHRPTSMVGLSAWLMIAGIILFSGSLYLLAVSGLSWLGMITPLGGLAFIAAWLLLGIDQLKSSSN